MSLSVQEFADLGRKILDSNPSFASTVADTNTTNNEAEDVSLQPVQNSPVSNTISNTNNTNDNLYNLLNSFLLEGLSKRTLQPDKFPSLKTTFNRVLYIISDGHKHTDGEFRRAISPTNRDYIDMLRVLLEKNGYIVRLSVNFVTMFMVSQQKLNEVRDYVVNNANKRTRK